MSALPIAIQSVGLVTSVGLTAPESCAAFRAKISNPSETRFIDSGGEWIMAHQVALEQPWRGLTKLAKMAAMAIEEALRDVPRKEWGKLPLLLCVAEAERPGRMAGLDEQLFRFIETELGVSFAPESRVVAQGRVSVAVALNEARALIRKLATRHVLLAATDSLLSWPTLSRFEREGRLLTPRNSNGFMPGEAAGALLVTAAGGETGEVACVGIGLGHEDAGLGSGEPLRAQGLSRAIKASLADAAWQMHDFDFRITDNSGEQYYFKEAALALSRTLRRRKEEFDIWHPAECIGEVGAASGVAVVAAAKAACGKGYAKGPNMLLHWANDAGPRAALSISHRLA